MRTRLALVLAFFACGAMPATEHALDFTPDTFDRSVDLCENLDALCNAEDVLAAAPAARIRVCSPWLDDPGVC